MREIKFRCWDKSIGKMAKVEVIDGQTSDTKILIGTEHDRILEWLPNMEHDCVLMQYTGLKDKNEKEIWEGDIVYIPNNESRATVYFGQYINSDNDGDRDEATDCGFHLKYCGDSFSEGLGTSEKYVEVIGNIWENRELLNDSK